MLISKDGKTLIQLAAILLIFVVYIDVTYLWVLPTFFGGMKTYFFFSSGVLGSFFCSSYFVYKNSDTTNGFASRIVLSIFSATIIAVLVFFFSLLIIVNVAGV